MTELKDRCRMASAQVMVALAEWEWPQELPRVLVIEDDEVFRKIYSRVLDEIVEVLFAHDPSSALHVFEEDVIDLVLSDYCGLPVVRALRSRGILTPFVVVSGHSYAPGFLEGDGVTEAFEKPLSPTAIVDLVSRYLIYG